MTTRDSKSLSLGIFHTLRDQWIAEADEAQANAFVSSLRSEISKHSALAVMARRHAVELDRALTAINQAVGLRSQPEDEKKGK